MFSKREKRAIEYFGGIEEFLSLCASYKTYLNNRPFSEHTRIDFDCTGVNGLCVVNQMCVYEGEKCLDLIIKDSRYCVRLDDKSLEYLVCIKKNLAEFNENLSEDYLDSFEFIKGRPFYVRIVNGIVVSIGLADIKMFSDNLTILDKL